MFERDDIPVMISALIILSGPVSMVYIFLFS